MNICNTNYRKLNKHLLSEGDKITFSIKGSKIHYTVFSRFLNNDGGSNRRIFDELGLDGENFCREHYGYEPKCGCWPESDKGDYAAITRTVKALFEFIENEQKKDLERVCSNGPTV